MHKRAILLNDTSSVWHLTLADRRTLERGVWGAVGALFLFILFNTAVRDAAVIMAACLIIAIAVAPSYISARGRVQGIPIFPIYALSAIWIYALPVLTAHPMLESYDSAQITRGCLTVALHFGSATFAWYMISTRPYKAPKYHRVLPAGQGDRVLLGLLAVAAVMTLGIQGAWFTNQGIFPIPGKILNILQRLIFGLVNLTIFLFSYRWGRGELKPAKRRAFMAITSIYCIGITSSLYLVSALTVTLLFTLGFTLGRRKVPWLVLIIILPLASMLHYGKHAMRDKYWDEFGGAVVQPWEYPAWYKEWLQHASANMPWVPDDKRPSSDHSSILERTSLMHLLVRVQAMSPEEVPYLYGKTYTIIPELMIPRILHPTRPSTLEGVRMLSIHYKLLDEESAKTTTIGWGLMNESVANFGNWGAIFLGIFIGLAYGQLSRITYSAPLLSFRTLFAFIVLGMAILFEFSLSVFATSLFQTTVPLIMLRLALMRKVPSAEYLARRIRHARASAPPVEVGTPA